MLVVGGVAGDVAPLIGSRATYHQGDTAPQFIDLQCRLLVFFLHLRVLPLLVVTLCKSASRVINHDLAAIIDIQSLCRRPA